MDIVFTNKGRGPLLHWCALIYSDLGPPVGQFAAEELIDKIDYAVRCELMGTHDLTVGPEIDIRLRYDQSAGAEHHHKGTWVVPYTLEFGKRTPWVEANHKSLVSAVARVTGKEAHYGVAFKETYVGR